MQAAISASPCSSRPPGWAGEALPTCVCGPDKENQRAALVSAATVFILSRLVSHQILISLPVRRIGSGSPAGQV